MRLYVLVVQQVLRLFLLCCTYLVPPCYMDCCAIEIALSLPEYHKNDLSEPGTEHLLVTPGKKAANISPGPKPFFPLD